MTLYEVVRWGNDSTDPATGGRNGPDTCFLVRARSVDAAASLVDKELTRRPSPVVDAWAGAVHVLGDDRGSGLDERIVRGPYTEHAYVHGWDVWYRDHPHEPWRRHAKEPPE